MYERFGESFAKLSLSRTDPGSRFMQEFQSIKKDFRKESYETHRLRFPMRDLDPNTTAYDFDNEETKLSRLEYSEDCLLTQIADVVDSKDLKRCFIPSLSKS